MLIPFTYYHGNAPFECELEYTPKEDKTPAGCTLLSIEVEGTDIYEMLNRGTIRMIETEALVTTES
jgi:hypothetical protein